VAYAETSLPQRRLLHRRIAQALEALNADDLDAVSAQTAAQYEQAGLFEQALPYYQRAGQMAASMYANEDAIVSLRRALALLSHFPAEVKRDVQELGLQLVLSSLYSIARGWASPEVEHCLNRALILSDKVGDPEQRAQTLYGLQTLYAVQAQLEKIQSIHPEMHKLFVQTQGSLPPNAGLMYASATFHSGHLLEGHKQFKNIVSVRDNRYFHNLLASEGWNYLVHGSAYLSHILWCLGYAQSALDNAHTAIEYAREFVQPFDQAKAITYLALLQEWRADTSAFRACAEEAYTLTEKYNAPYYHAWASILLHFAQAWQQPDSESLNRLQKAIHIFTGMGAHLRLPVYFSLLARACQRAGRIDQGLEAIEQGFSESLQNGEHWWDAELHRLCGGLIWSQGAELDAVEAAFRRAIEIAQSQQAKSLELRAATSLARLWQATGKPAAAKKLLTPLYAWFSEGFDTPDLQKAQALLAEL
jgi:tetratricopeptide (TPR) repeat protein